MKKYPQLAGGAIDRATHQILSQVDAKLVDDAERLNLEGFDPNDGESLLRAVALVKLVGADITLNAGDITVGSSMEIKSGDGATIATVVPAGTGGGNNAVSVMLTDESGAPITKFIKDEPTVSMPVASSSYVVSDAVTVFAALDGTSKKVRISINGAEGVMVTYDGTDPTTTVGELWKSGDIVVLDAPVAALLKLTRPGLLDASVYITEFN